MKTFCADTAKSASDMLRAQLESAVGPPAVIAMASCSAADGQDIVARTLAYSFATAGYSTLFVDTSLASKSIATPADGLPIDEIGRRQPVPDASSGQLGVLTLSDLALQRATNKRRLESGLDILRSKFDYIVLTTDYNVSTAFAATVIDSADAVIACVKARRRQTASDKNLSNVLDRLGLRYLGVITSDPSTMRDESVAAFHNAVIPPRYAKSARFEIELQRRKMAESPT